MSDPAIIDAHRLCTRNRREVESSEQCGCFHCLAVFPSSAIKHWLNEGDGTALCPECNIDSVIGSASGLPITAEFLGAMQRHWFGEPPAA